MKNLFNKLTSMVMTTVMLLGITLAAPALAFPDVQNHWAKADILELAEKKILGGKDANWFDPEANITRAEYVAICNRAFPEAISVERNMQFSDVTSDYWFYADVLKAANAKLIEGRSSTTFDPMAPITRQEAAVITHNYLVKIEFEFTESSKTVNDMHKVAEWAKTPVTKLVKSEIIGGYEDGEFRPNSNITRAESATVTNRVCKILDELLGDISALDPRNQLERPLQPGEAIANSHASLVSLLNDNSIHTIIVDGTIQLTGPISLTFLASSRTVTLKARNASTGAYIVSAPGARHFIINAPAGLHRPIYMTLANVQLQGGTGSVVDPGLAVKDDPSGSLFGLSSVGSNGGGIEVTRTAWLYITGANTIPGFSNITNCRVSGNGGGVLSYGYFSMHGNAKISGNFANKGGGVYVASADNYSPSYLRMYGNTKISENTAEFGGGIYTDYSIEIWDNASIDGNTARQSGGGIYINTSLNDLFIKIKDNASIINNKAVNGDGGGIFTLHNRLKNLTIPTGVTFAGNTASKAYLMNDSTDIALHNAQIKTNTISPPKPKFQYAYNNYDISYTKGLAYIEPYGTPIPSPTQAPTAKPTLSPTAKPTAIPMVDVSCGNHHSVSLASNGDVWAWGQNNGGQLGNGTTVDKHEPTKINTLSGKGITAIAESTVSDHSIALASNGDVWAWGNNASGQLGDVTTTNRSIPVKITALSGKSITKVVTGGGHSMALDSNGDVWGWGYAMHGELGDGSYTMRTNPIKIPALSGKDFTKISAGLYHNLALDSNGDVWAWGCNCSGEVGNGETTNCGYGVYIPFKITALSGKGITAVKAGCHNSFALASNGDVWAWGNNAWGKLGDGTEVNRLTPVKNTILSGKGIAKIESGWTHTIALASNGDVWASGWNSWGQIGDGTTTEWHTPVKITALSGKGITAISAGYAHNLACASNGDLWSWGLNSKGQLGDGTTTNRRTPVKITN